MNSEKNEKEFNKLFDDDLFNDDVIIEKKGKKVDFDELDFKEKTKILDEFVLNNTRHEAVVPIDNETYSPIEPKPKMTFKTFKFQLDTFQQLAISAVESDNNVLVSAHTSCGKTVVAEYAIAQSIANKQRVIYTSPIKALSNQKFRELKEEFEDVGLMTGDVTLNPEATCIVMTTEILRNMLYKGSPMVREMHWIVFDEIHYMKDKDRGVVWEETIILLPSHVRMIFLSATIPNAREFGEWITNVSSQVVHIVYTEKRVIPLVHYFYSADNVLREIKSQDGEFNSENFIASQSYTIPRKNVENTLLTLLDTVNLPAVVFSFARASCEQYAFKLSKNFLNNEERELVRTIFARATDILSEEDSNLPAIKGMLALFERGIGIHHSGLVPVVKELSEILFQESLIKVLFATETFSIGLNMPAKTVIFTSIKKFDGVSERILTSGEYTQMSGRAGRRGIDDKGAVISLVTDEIDSKSIIQMLNKGSDKLISAFRLTYNMILNLMRVDDFDTFFMLSRSFHHYQAYKNALEISRECKKPKLLNELSINESGGATDKSPITQKELEKDGANIDPAVKENIKKFKDYEKMMIDRNKELSGTLCDYIKKSHQIIDIMIPREGIPLFLRNCIVNQFLSLEHGNYVSVFLESGKEFECRTFPSDWVSDVYDFRGKVNTKVFRKKFSKIHFPYKVSDKEINKIEKELMISRKVCLICKQKTYLCLLKNSKTTPVENIDEYKFQYSSCIDIRKQSILESSKKKIQTKKSNKTLSSSEEKDTSTSSTTSSSSDRIHAQDKHNIVTNLETAINHCIFDIEVKQLENQSRKLLKLKEIYHMEECKKKIDILRQLGHLEGNSCTLKGKMASEISSADELLLTEMIFSTSFNKLSIIDMIALLSVVVTEKSKEGKGVQISEENQTLIETIFTPSIKYIVQAFNKCGFDEIDEVSYYAANNLNFYMMDIVRMWVSGYSFADVCKSTKVFEGSIIRGFKRLEEILRQLVNAAMLIGNDELVNIFSQAIFLIKRDIVFTNSLYVL